MTAPKVTIKVGGKVITGGEDESSAPTEEDLYMLYVQAAKGDSRYQWVVFPPAVKDLGASEEDKNAVMLNRHQAFAGNRSKWFRSTVNDVESFVRGLDNYLQRGYEVGCVVVVSLEKDDYNEIWNDGLTPHKALRAVGRALENSHNITLK